MSPNETLPTPRGVTGHRGITVSVPVVTSLTAGDPVGVKHTLADDPAVTTSFGGFTVWEVGTNSISLLVADDLVESLQHALDQPDCRLVRGSEP